MMMEITEIIPNCSFSWEKLKEMKDHDTKFWAADGLNLLRIVEIDEKQRSFYVINQSGKITWPLRYGKLEEVHDKIHHGEITLLSYEIDKLIPTWGNYISGLFKHFGCDKG
jgi:predicted GNAT family acetyltransferase